MPAYAVAQSDILNGAQVLEYSKAAAPSLAKYGGRFIMRGHTPKSVKEGSWAENRVITVVEFRDMETAEAWYYSEEYQSAIPVRKGAMDMQLLLVDGINPDDKPIG